MNNGTEGKETTSEMECSNKNEKANYLTLQFTERFKMRVYKPLLPIKTGYFIWMTASSSVLVYFYVYLKLQGLTITDLFWINTLTSVATVIEIPLLAILVDKLGISSKSALISNILISCCLLFSISQVYPMPNCEMKGFYDCHNDSVTFSANETTCGIRTELVTSWCEVRCLEKEDYVHHSSLSRCNDSETVHSFVNHSKSLCEGMRKNESCTVSCPMVDPERCGHRRSLMFAAYAVLTCLFMATYANVFRFIDVTAVALLKEHHFDYGAIRFWGILGSLLGPSLTGLVVRLATPGGEPTDYKVGFYLQTGLFLLTVVVCSRIDVRPLAPGVQLGKKISGLVRIPDVLVVMFVLIILGTTWGFNILFKTWYLNDIGGEAQALSTVNTMMALYGLPFLYCSERIVLKVGSRRLLVLALLGHAVHSFGYSAIDDAWYAVILEITAVVSYHLMWVSVVDITREITPEGLLTTVNSTAGNLHFNCGRITASFFGGFLMKTYGGRFTYRIMGIINTVMAVLYVIYLYLQHRWRENKINLI